MFLFRIGETYPDEDEDFGVTNPVLAIGHLHHGELRRAGTFLHQVPYL